MAKETAMPTHLEVPLTPDAKLVIIRSDERLFLRLRALDGGAWKFQTPPLEILPTQLVGLTGVDADKGFPVKFEHAQMEGELNLLIYHGTVHVHFGQAHIRGSGAAFADALLTLSGKNAS